MSRNPLTSGEISQIKEMLLAGRSHNSIAKAIGRSQSTVSDLARREGLISPINRVPKAAIEARKHHALEDKLEATSELMSKVIEIARGATTGREVKECATAWGILTDKMLLMEGLPTSRSETHTSRSGAPTINLEEEFRKLDEEWEAQQRAENS